MMKEPAKPATTRRLTREDWIAAARKVLISSGIDDVKVDLLARRMKMTRGSFYWHFGHRKDLLDALLSDWESRNHLEISRIRTRWDETGADLTDVIAVWIGEDAGFPSFDIAMRAWSRKSRPVAEVLHRVDEAWVQLLMAIFLKKGQGEEESLVRARVIYYHQVGYYATGVKELLADRIRRLPLYYEALTGEHAPADLVETIQRRSTRDRRARRFAPIEAAAGDAGRTGIR